jgi:hypothetical protein
MRRSLAAIPLALSALLLLAASAAAGGWADIRADATTADEPPVAGQPLTIGFTVLQHGVTPVSWVTPIVTARDLVSGATIDVTVAPSGPEGHFAGSFTPTQAGYWTWSVQLQDLLSDPFTVAVAVRGADGTVPTLDAAQLINATQGASQDLRLQLEDRMGSDYAMIEQRFARLATLDDRLDREVRALADQRDALAARVEALEAAAGGGATPAGSPLAIVLLAVLAGATAGFAMSWLAGRPGVRAAAVSDPATPLPAGAAPRGSTPA